LTITFTGIPAAASNSCPASATSTTAARLASITAVSYSISEPGAYVVEQLSQSFFPYTNPAVNANQRSMSVEKLDSVGDPLSWAAGDSVTFTLDTDYTCTYSDNTEKTVTNSRTQTVTFDGSAWSIGAGSCV
jgi:hypothetical protein